MTRDLVHFLDALSLYLQAGYDLSFAWPATYSSLQHDLSPFLGEYLAGDQKKGLGMGDVLRSLSDHFPVSRHRVWFSVLGELYLKGAGLNQGVLAFSESLRRELRRDIEEHCRSLSTKVNVLMLVFFLPPTLFLLFVPLLIEILRAF